MPSGRKLDELTHKASEEIAKRPMNSEPGEDVGLDGPQVSERIDASGLEGGE
jgi:hypothetical protein